jgi:DNA polymerase-3 subunit beta
MKIEGIKEKLQSALIRVGRVVGKNVNLPILSCILLSARNGILSIKATNLDAGVEITLPVKIEKEGVAAVPGVVLTNLVSQMYNTKNIIFEVCDNNLVITTRHSTSRVKLLPHDDFPVIPTVSKSISFRIPVINLINGLHSVVFSASPTSVKPELSSVLLFVENNSLVFTATDAFRLAEKRIPIKVSIGDFGQLLIPFRNISDIIRVFDGIDGELDVAFTKNQVGFYHPGVYITSRLVDGVFPDYKQIIPKEYVAEAIVLKHDLMNAMKVGAIFSNSYNQATISLSPSKKTFKFITRNKEVGENTEIVDCALSGEDIDIKINYKYLSDVFQSLNTDSISLRFSGKNKPMVVTGVSDNSFTYLIMPMNE